MPTKTEVIYKLNGINAEEGVDIFQIAPILMSFGELIRSANDTLGFEEKIDVKVKPFREGSWITEFVFHSQVATTLFNHLDTPNGQNLVTILSLLGLNAKEGISGVLNIIRFTKGKVSNFRKNTDEKTVVYENENGEKITVTLPEHRLIQSPIVQINYYNSVVTPLENFPSAESVAIKINSGNSTEEVFTEEDKQYFEEYARTELLEDVEESISTMTGVFIKPKRGSYSGEEKAYSFVMGDAPIYPVTLEDQEFVRKLQAGEVRLYFEDVLRVNLEIRQKKDRNNKINTRYSIVHVEEYSPYEKPQQLTLDSHD